VISPDAFRLAPYHGIPNTDTVVTANRYRYPNQVTLAKGRFCCVPTLFDCSVVCVVGAVSGFCCCGVGAC
jgi:hypothetical protein